MPDPKGRNPTGYPMTMHTPCTLSIRKADSLDAGQVGDLAAELWPHHEPASLHAEFRELLLNEDAAVFMLFDGTIPAGFAQCQLRHDYVEGASGSPVGYLEGLYIRPPYRKQGMAERLLERCQDWAVKKGCTEFASDCGLDNRQSLAFHLRTGFTEANRIICFVKKLSSARHSDNLAPQG